MKFTIQVEELLQHLELLKPLADKDATIPALRCCYFQASDEALTITSSNLECFLMARTGAVVIEAGSAILPLRRLRRLIRQIGAPEVIIETNDKDAKVSAGALEVRLNLWGDDYPKVPKCGEVALTIDSMILEAMIRHTLYAVTPEESRYSLNGSRLALTGRELSLVATDGHRLCLSEETLASDNPPFEKLIPADAQRRILAILEEEPGGPVAVGFKGERTFFRVGSYALSADSLRKFPDYTKIIPANKIAVTVNRALLLSALHRVRSLGDMPTRPVTITFNPDSELLLTSESVDYGKAEERVPFVSMAGLTDPVGISFFSRYLIEPLESVNAWEVRLEIKDHENPILLTPVDENSERLRVIVMPMRKL